ncbi:ABC transporter permease [Parvibium lacunae]|uniref:Iron ABC transporter permease n=1 Tax=Parvibium lacunae TaxID=1888893 RepID=A0A368L8C9_9BURK|nr:iron ABC transporter permease [Parvibium lacunae]RCS59771.1 iron ABC transporter permease [Parvibium lacunae]
MVAWLSRLFPTFVALLVAIPVLGVLSNVLDHSLVSATAQTTWQHLLDTILPDYTRVTGALVLWVALGVIAGGSMAAWLVALCEFPGRKWLEWGLILPLAMPAYVSAYAYTDFLQFTGPVQTALRHYFGWEYGDYWFPEIRSLGGAALMFIAVLYPYVYLLARNNFLERSPAMLEAARSMGYQPWQVFWRVSLPLARPAIVAGATLALMEVLADYGTVAYFGVTTFTTGIYRAWFSLGDRAAAAQLASMLLGIIFLLVVFEQLSRGRARFYTTGQRLHGQAVRPLTGWLGWGATLFCFLPILLGFLLPTFLLLRLAWQEWQLGQLLADSRYLHWLFNSVLLASLTAICAVMAALWLAYAQRSRPSRWQSMCNRIVSLGYAVPGAIIAVGVLIPLAKLDNFLADWLAAQWGWQVGLLFTGTMIALIYAYLVRFFAVAYQGIDAGLQKITPAMDASARSLGYSPLGVLRKVHIPLLWRSLLAAGLLVFVDVMKELPATLVLRPFNYDTLAVIAHQFATDERLGEAALPALTIVLVGLLPVMLLSRTMLKNNS